MEAKAIKDLCQLTDQELFSRVAEGLDLIYENATTLAADAQILADQEKWRGARILTAIAEEEAAKFLILLDAIRCPRITGKDKRAFNQQLKNFNDHFAKLLYVRYCWISPVNFAEVRGWVEAERPEFYLDGPEYISWIFRNQLVQGRESQIYVDYLRTEEGNSWTSPKFEVELLKSASVGPSMILNLVNALRSVGICSAGALEIIADKWRSIGIHDEMHITEIEDLNRQTVKILASAGLPLTNTNEIEEIVAGAWLFPLYPLDLTLKTMDKKELRKQQEIEKEKFWSEMF